MNSASSIPRYQLVLFLILLLVSAALGGLLWHLRTRAHERMLAGKDSTPTQAPQVAPLERATLMVARDADDTIGARALSLPLPQEPGARARAVLGKLLDLYAEPDSTHSVPGGAASVAQVFLLPVAGSTVTETKAGGGFGSAASGADAGPELALVNLTGTFAASHPSGLETETLTVLSMCATLNANLPRIAEVRFLVNGEPRSTLAGHADLTRTYLTGDTVMTELERQ